jgi:hypothetical protein
MIIHCRCASTFTGDAFGNGDYEKFLEGRVYALPSSFIQANIGRLEVIHKKETKPLRTALEVKGNNTTRKRARKSK